VWRALEDNVNVLVTYLVLLLGCLAVCLVIALSVCYFVSLNIWKETHTLHTLNVQSKWSVVSKRTLVTSFTQLSVWSRKTNYTVKCVCLTANLIKVMLLFWPIPNLPAELVRRPTATILPKIGPTFVQLQSCPFPRTSHRTWKLWPCGCTG